MQLIRQKSLNQQKGRIRGLNDPRIVPYILISPFAIYFFAVYFYPIISSIIMSFQKFEGIYNTTFIGLRNYEKLFKKDFLMALGTTARYTLWDVLILIPVPLLFAVILCSKHAPFPSFFKALYFIPSLTSVIVAGIVFRLAFGDLDTSLANRFLGLIGQEPQKWLYHAGTANFVLIILTLWRWMGVNIVYFYSSIQAIPEDLYEAAMIDGANAVQSFFNITLPGIKNTLIYVITITVMGGFSMFTESVALWQQQYPGGTGRTIVGYLYMMGSKKNDIGLGSAVGIVLLVMVCVVNLIQLVLMGFFRKEADS